MSSSGSSIWGMPVITKEMCENCWFNFSNHCVAPNVTPESKEKSKSEGVCRSAAKLKNEIGPVISGKMVRDDHGWSFVPYEKRYVT